MNTLDLYFFQSRVQNLSLEQCQNLLVGIATRTPSLIFNLLDESTIPSDQPPTPSMSSNLPWCTCTRCRDMPTDTEKVCCGRLPDQCTTLLPVSV